MKVSFYDENLLEPLVEYIKIVWDREITPEIFLKEREKDLFDNPYGKEGGFPIALLMDNNSVVCQVAAIPCKLLANNNEYLAYWLSGLYLLPAYRGKGLGKVIPQALTDNLPIVTGFFVVEEALQIYKKLGWTIVGKIPEYLKIVNTKAFFGKIDLEKITEVSKEFAVIFKKINSLRFSPNSSVLSLLMDYYKIFWKMFLPKIRSNKNIINVRDFDERIDNLWNAAKRSLRFAEVRDSRYLNWQFKHKEGWIKIVYDDKLGNLGYAILSIKRFSEGSPLDGMKVLSIIDLLWNFNEPNILCELIDYAEKLAVKEGCDILLCSVNNKAAKRILRRRAFIKIPSTVFFAYHCSINTVQFSGNLDEWYITRGDADAAGALGPGY